MLLEKFKVSERRACRVVGQNRSTQRNESKESKFDKMIRERVIELAKEYGRYGYRKVHGLLEQEGLQVNHKRVEKIWKEEGLKVPQKQPKRKRLWLNDGSCIRKKPEFPNHVWAYDFIFDSTHDKKTLKMLVVIDEFTRECLTIRVERRLTSKEVLETLYDLFLIHGAPMYIRSDNGPEFVAKSLRKWLKNVGVDTLFIEPGSPWENGYIESFNGKFRYELLTGELFYTLKEAKIIVEMWRHQYNTKRPHKSLNNKPPAPEAFIVKDYYLGMAS